MSQQASNTETEGQPLAPAPQKGRRWKLVFFGIIILLCGVVIGAGSTAIFRHKMLVHGMQRHDRMHGRAATHMKKRLNLSDEQAKEVEKILDNRMGAVRMIWREAYTDSRGQITLMKEEMSKVLTEEQAQKLRRRFRRYERAFPPPPPLLKEKSN